ncbi:MAG: phosphoenolpyruvate carboxykinase (ATP) [Peptoniphilaceae bacterium]|nr:phosphoenolpyruvate carboxykinase (ATP) [Peptoniphilaceae bacterium]
MATKRTFSREELGPKLPMMSALRTIIETPFYGNNVVEVKDLAQAYEMAKNSPGTVVTDLPIEQPEALGLPADAKVLLFNDGSVTGRAAAARRIVGDEGVNVPELNKKVMDAVYETRWNTMYHAQVFVGLDEDFMVRAHLLIPEGEENILYDWMLNFQPVTEKYEEMYKNSKPIEGEGDIYVFSDPQWSHPDHPLGLTYFDSAHNCAALLGMKYFGEHKKGTLTLAWSIANRHDYACCHGGCKTFNPDGEKPYTLAVFGLSGSGKSTLTHAKHDGKYDIRVLHDDAFIISTNDFSSIALEPAYFDKTADYPASSPDNKYLLTVQNCGITLDDDGHKIIVSEDIRNGNGRAVKSRLWSPNRVDVLHQPMTAVAWIMKDPVLPPLVRVHDPAIAALMGATLSTKRSSAERLAKGVDPNALVIEPYANPFRTYPLNDDFKKFHELFEQGVACYILNTGSFLDQKVPKEVTIAAIESLVDETTEWQPMAALDGCDAAVIEGFEVPDTAEYHEQVKGSMQKRTEFLQSQKDFNRLPEEMLTKLLDLVK